MDISTQSKVISPAASFIGSTVLMILMMAIPQTIFVPVHSQQPRANQNHWHIHVAKYLLLLFPFDGLVVFKLVPFFYVDFKSLFIPPLQRVFLENNSSSTMTMTTSSLSLSLLEFD